MARRFQQYYKTHRLDNLGDPDWHDRRWEDIDLRMANREADATKIDDAVDRMEAVALARLNETFRPIIEQAHDLLADVGVAFNGQSLTEEQIGPGTKTFIITEQYRVPLVVVEFVSVRPTGHSDIGMTCTVTSYNRETGALVVEPIVGYIVGASTILYNDWQIRVSITPNLDTYTRAETDDWRNDLIDGAPDNLNTIGELARAIGGDSDTLLFRAANLGDLTSPPLARTNLGLGNVNNTSDANKPVSILQRAAIDTAVAGVAVVGVFVCNTQVLSTNYTLATGQNAMSVGPITIGTGARVTIPVNSRWVVI